MKLLNPKAFHFLQMKMVKIVNYISLETKWVSGDKMKSRSKRGVSNTLIIVVAVLIVIILAAGVYAYLTLVPPRPKDTLIMGTTDSVETGLDPALAYDFFGWEIIQATGSGLVDIRPGTPKGASADDIIPALALNWSSTTDGLHWTFNLRQGVKFADGTEFNATHVKYTFDRGIGIAASDGPFVGIGYSDIIDNVQVVSKYQVKFNLKIPFSAFLSLMACQASFIVNPKYAPKNEIINYTDGNPRASYPMDLGPYNLTEWVRTAGRDEEMRLAANPNYWNASGGYPKTKNIIIKFYSDATTLGLAIEGGEIDIAFRQLRSSDINALKTNTSVKVWQGTGAFIQYMVFQETIKPFDNARVRRAIAAAINRTDLTQTVFLGQAAPLYSMIPNGMAGHTDAFKTLGDANYTFTKSTLNDKTIYGGPYNSTHKLVIDLWYEISGHYPQSADQGLVLKNSLEASGVIKVNLNGLDWAAYKLKRDEGTMPVYIYGWYPDYVDPDDYTYPFLHSAGSSWLNNHYNNTQMDNLIMWARGNTTATARNNLYAQIQTLMVQDTPMVSLYQGSAWAVTKPNVKGVYLDITQDWRHWLVYAQG
jgi:peptide/nickel transport system substrate-binding protein